MLLLPTSYTELHAFTKPVHGWGRTSQGHSASETHVAALTMKVPLPFKINRAVLTTSLKLEIVLMYLYHYDFIVPQQSEAKLSLFPLYRQ